MQVFWSSLSFLLPAGPQYGSLFVTCLLYLIQLPCLCCFPDSFGYCSACRCAFVGLFLVVLMGYCAPVLSGALHVVSSITSSTWVVVFPVSDDWHDSCTSVCDAVCWSRLFFWSVCTDSALFVAVLVVLQLTAHRAVSSMRAIVDFLNSACKFAHIFS